MYLTAKELHIAFDIKAQWLNSNRERVIMPEEKDMLLNRAMYQFIDVRCSRKLNVKKEGFEDTQKRYDDLRELKNSFSAPTYIDSDFNSYNGIDRVLLPLPFDYYHLINSRSFLKYNCNYLNKVLASTGIAQYIAIPILPETGVFNNFYIALSYNNGSVVTTNIIDLSTYEFTSLNKDNVFETINICLDTYNNLNGNIELFYTTIGSYNYFMILNRVPSTSFSLVGASSSGINYDIQDLSTLISYDLTKVIANMSAPNSLESSSSIDSMMLDYYFTKNLQESPLCTLDNSSLYLYENNTIAITSASITYIRKPKLINIKTNQGCELSQADEIVDIAVEIAKANLASQNYKEVINDNIKKE
jgi:hypothetical protein